MDVRKIKTSLRKKHKQTRKNLTQEQKQEKDTKILNKLLDLEQYKKASLVVCFVSTSIEVDTFELIKKAWSDNKKVAVPRCMEQSGIMRFFYINSFDDLELGKYSLLEPKVDVCKLVEDYHNSICIVPALAFDNKGYRLGYGKGYYDRFLSKYKNDKIGICYSECTEYMLPYGKYDISVDMLITDSGIKNFNGKA